MTLRGLLRRMRTAAYVASFPLYSLLSPKLGFTVFFRRDGAWHAYSRGRSFRVHEPRLWAMEYFRHFVPARGAVVLDVGGELGFESAQFAELVGEQGKVIVFECMPEHVKGLQALAAKHRQMSVVNCACWNEVTQLEFFLGNTPGSNTAVPDAKGQRGQTLASNATPSLKVDAKPLDMLWKELLGKQPVDFLKMDIEGAEYEALEGARELLGQTRFAVIAAYHIRDDVPTASRVDQMLKASGFKTRVDENLHVYAWR